ncbi:MAG: hypothetical protein AB7P16_25525 [Bradyrhizobium sp.]
MNTNAGAVISGMTDIERRQIPFASALALTRTAQEIHSREQHEMRDVFDRPTPWTLSALRVKPATKTKLEASVEFKDFAGKGVPATKFLPPQVYGGGRNMKRFERALSLVGVLPPNYMAVPGEAARRDAWGNMDRGQIVQILSYFRAFPESGYRANITDKRRASLAKGSKKRYGVVYFTTKPGGRLPPGVWMREIHGLGSRIRPILIFVTRAYYEAIFDFHYVAERTAQEVLPKQFDQAMAEALRTAR